MNRTTTKIAVPPESQRSEKLFNLADSDADDSEHDSDHDVIPPRKATEPVTCRHFVVLFVCWMTTFSLYMAFDVVFIVADEIESDCGLTASQMGIVDSAYNVPNIILPLIGGAILTRLGTRRGTLIFSIVACAGAALLWLSVVFLEKGSVFVPLTVGRSLYGAGAESSYVATSTILSDWFASTPFLATAMAASLSAEYVGDIIGFSFLRTVVDTFFSSWKSAIGLTTTIQLIAVVLIVVYVWLDARRSGQPMLCGRRRRRGHDESDDDEAFLLDDDDDERIDVDEFFDDDVVERRLRERSHSKKQQRVCCADLRSLGIAYWLTWLFIVCQSTTVFSFMAWPYDLIGVLSNGAFEEPDIDSSLLYFSVSGCFAGVVGGILFDRFGKRGTVMIASSLALMMAFLALCIIAPTESYLLHAFDNNSTNITTTTTTTTTSFMTPTATPASFFMAASCNCTNAVQAAKPRCVTMCGGVAPTRHNNTMTKTPHKCNCNNAAMAVLPRCAMQCGGTTHPPVTRHHNNATKLRPPRRKGHRHHRITPTPTPPLPPNYTAVAPEGLSWVLPLALMGQGLAFSLGTAASWPCISFLTEERVSGIAFGLIGAAVNLVSACMNIALGALFDSHTSPRMIMLLFVGLSSTCLLAAVALMWIDKRRIGLIQLPSTRIAAIIGRDISGE